jgi:hypothetical protein
LDNEHGARGDKTEEQREIRQLPRKHVRAGHGGEDMYAAISHAELRTNIIPAKIKRRRITKLSIKEVMKVLKAVKEDYLTHASAAVKYSTTISTVAKIVRNFKYKSDYEGELLEKRATKEGKLAAAISTI